MRKFPTNQHGGVCAEWSHTTVCPNDLMARKGKVSATCRLAHAVYPRLLKNNIFELSTQHHLPCSLQPLRTAKTGQLASVGTWRWCSISWAGFLRTAPSSPAACQTAETPGSHNPTGAVKPVNVSWIWWWTWRQRRGEDSAIQWHLITSHESEELQHPSITSPLSFCQTHLQTFLQFHL